jgi:transposase
VPPRLRGEFQTIEMLRLSSSRPPIEAKSSTTSEFSPRRRGGTEDRKKNGSVIYQDMRGRQPRQTSLLCLLDVEKLVPRDHSLRGIKSLADEALKDLSRSLGGMYSKTGRPSIPPERLLKGMLLIALYSVRSEIQFCEQLRYNFLFRWFLDMDMMEEPFDHCAFSDNRDRFLEHDVAGKFFREVVKQAQEAELMSSDHFSVDGTLIEAWASMKSFRPKDEDDDDSDSNGWSDFKGQKRKNDTHESKTDPEARLMRKGKGKEAKLSFAAHSLTENRNGLLVDFEVTEANGTCEREAAVEMLDASVEGDATLGADSAYDTQDFVAECRARGITPHVAQKRNSAIDGRTTRHPGYQASQTVRKRIEQVYGWLKSFGGFRKTRYKGRAKTELYGLMAASAYNLLRMAKLMGAPA